MKHHILFVDDNDSLRESMQSFFAREGFAAKCVSSGSEAIALVRQKIFPFSLGVVDFHLPDMTGAQVIARIRELDPDIITLGFSDDKSDPVHNESLDSGAISFINKDAGDSKLLGILHRHCREYERRKKPLTISSRAANSKLIETIDMKGCSNHLAEIARLVHKYAQTTSTVLIRGENGTGKEKIAQALHKISPRRAKPFVAVNCGAFPKDLIESELFGHEKGAFTGASQSKVGKFQAADGGTLFLDEIGELELNLQSVLLRALQEKVITPVGSNASEKVDVRIVAATNAPLEDMIERKKFRQDLFFRLNVLPIYLNPLRDHPEDIPYLAEFFLERVNFKQGTQKIILDADVEVLQRMPWPGNVRELEHAIEYLVTICDERELNIARLKEKSKIEVASPKPQPILALDQAEAAMEKQERAIIEKALQSFGTIAGTARGLNVSRSTLRDKIKRLGIEIHRNDEEVI